jgi:hypothetical protein
MTGTHHHSRILRLLRGFTESFLATLTEWNASTFLGTKGDASVGLVDLDGSSDCFRAVRSEKNGGEFRIAAQCTQEKVFQADFCTTESQDSDVSLCERSCFILCHPDRAPCDFTVAIRTIAARFQVPSWNAPCEIGKGAVPETNSLAGGVCCAKLIAEMLRHGFFVSAPVSTRISLE